MPDPVSHALPTKPLTIDDLVTNLTHLQTRIREGGYASQLFWAGMGDQLTALGSAVENVVTRVTSAPSPVVAPPVEPAKESLETLASPLAPVSGPVPVVVPPVVDPVTQTDIHRVYAASKTLLGALEAVLAPAPVPAVFVIASPTVVLPPPPVEPIVVIPVKEPVATAPPPPSEPVIKQPAA
jgi:hypothetical protein